VLEFFLIDNFHFEFIPEGAVVSMVWRDAHLSTRDSDRDRFPVGFAVSS
jgi:hypothetical protein